MNPRCLKFIKNEFREIDATMHIMVKMVSMVKMVIMVVMVIMVAKVIMVTKITMVKLRWSSSSSRASWS